MKTWNLGNTTVRNPSRIREGLKILQKYFLGKDWNESQQASFYEKLVDENIMEAQGDKLPSPKTRGINGRKWVAAPNQLGFCKAWSKGPVELTDAGLNLIASSDLRNQEEVFLRQLLKYQLPSPIENGSEYSGFEIMPFRFMLHVLLELDKRGFNGFTKEEIALFVVTKVRNREVNKAVDQIGEYRKKRDALKGGVAKRELFRKSSIEIVRELYKDKFDNIYNRLKNLHKNHEKLSQSELLKELKDISASGKGSDTKNAVEFVREALSILKNHGAESDLINLFDEMRISIHTNTLMDYADSAARYASLSGLFSISGQKLILMKDKMKLIQQLVSEGFPHKSDKDFTDLFYKASEPTLPTDDLSFLSSYVKELEERRNQLKDKLKIAVSTKTQAPKTLNLIAVKEYRFALETEVGEYKEYEFYKKQSEPSSIADIYTYFDGIKNRTLMGGQTYLPAFFEWSIWRVFLAINTIEGNISESRNFRIDEELNPIHTAKSGAADMVFHYEDFIIPCEVTLNRGENQYSAEGESVARHVGHIALKTKKEVYSIFVAPSINPQTAQQFYLQTWHDGNDKYISLNIIPFTIDQMIIILKCFEANGLTVMDLKNCLKHIIGLKKSCTNGAEWLKEIDTLFSKFSKTLLLAA